MVRQNGQNAAKNRLKNGKVKNPRLTCRGNVAKAGPEGLQDSKEPLLKPCRQYTSIRIRRKETLIKKMVCKKSVHKLDQNTAIIND